MTFQLFELDTFNMKKEIIYQKKLRYLRSFIIFILL